MPTSQFYFKSLFKIMQLIDTPTKPNMKSSTLATSFALLKGKKLFREGQV